MKKIILDTNAFSSYLRGDEKVLDTLVKADIVYMPAIVLGELFTGFTGGAKETWNKDILSKFLNKPRVEVLDVTIETSEIFGMIYNTLKKAGSLIPINDVWIAANTMETGSVLVTYDSHFNKIPGLRLWDYN